MLTKRKMITHILFSVKATVLMINFDQIHFIAKQISEDKLIVCIEFSAEVFFCRYIGFYLLLLTSLTSLKGGKETPLNNLFHFVQSSFQLLAFLRISNLIKFSHAV